MKKRLSLKDIAKKLNVSVTTVSFVLNGKGKEKKISDEVIKRVQDYVEEINYRPNPVAQSLRTGKTKILVFMVEDISNQFFSRIARIIEDIAYERGYKVIFCSNENDDNRSLELIDLFYERQVDGFIIIPSPGIKKRVEILQQNVPVILFDRFFEDLQSNYAVINNEKSAHEATEHLIERDFKNIGLVTIASKQMQMAGRKDGYQKAISEANIKENILEIPFSSATKEEGRKEIRKYLESNNDLDALFFATNYLTQLGLEVLRDHFPNKINEIGILTFDDNELFRIYSPSISAVAQPLDEIGEELMRIMFELLDMKSPGSEIYQSVLDTRLVIRDSSAAKVKS